MDLVYTWVDDTFPGYRELMQGFSRTGDINPNRTRDNLQILRYSLRSVARNLPAVRNVVFFTMRPQVPDWLDTSNPKIRIVHHDEVMDRALLPTFNSFAIVTHLHLIPGLSQRFIYMEDDMLLMAPCERGDFEDKAGRIRVFEQRKTTPVHGRFNMAKASRWNVALAEANRLLDERFAARRRRHVNHVPLMIDKDIFAEMLSSWPQAVTATRKARFRTQGNVAPEYLYPQFLLETKRGTRESASATKRMLGYVPIENFYLYTLWKLFRARRREPHFVTLNDNFGARPNPRVEGLVRKTLEKWLPDKSPFEKS